MERGLYVAASGMLAQQTIQDDLASNIANANTIGYKQDKTTFRELQTVALHRLQGGSNGPEIGSLGEGVVPDQLYTDWTVGALSKTGNPLDISLTNPNQFIALQTPNGERYTRAGNLQLDKSGNLVTSGGLSVLNANNQPVNVGKQTNVTFDSAGNLTANGQVIAKVKIVEPAPNDLVRDGDSLYAAKNPALVRAARSPKVSVGTLEESNLNPVTGMVKLITVSRAFEMAQRALTTQDELLRHAANEVGKM